MIDVKRGEGRCDRSDRGVRVEYKLIEGFWGRVLVEIKPRGLSLC